ncbi:MAG: hypothetical protein ACRD0M_12050 [Acidimicrobiales bacterium]
MSAPVTRSDIEEKLRRIRGEVDSATEAAKPLGAAIAAGVAVAVLAVAYLVGRRHGRRRRAVVEIRRV